MAGDHVLWGDFFADRRLDSTLRHCKWATRVEAAARGRIERARYLAAYGQLLVPVVRVRGQGSGKEGLGIGVERLGAELKAVGELDDLAEIHDRDPMADMGHGGQVMADEEITDPERLLQ